MTPAEFADVVVVPTVREHLAARGDRRLAYLACIATYSLVEYVTRAEAGAGASKAALDKARADVGAAIRAVCAPAYEVVQGICNGTKHAGSDRGQFPFTPGNEMAAYRSSLQSIGGLFVGKLFPGDDEPERYTSCLLVRHDMRHWAFDDCIQSVLCAFMKFYPQYLGNVDLSFLDVQFRPTSP